MSYSLMLFWRSSTDTKLLDLNPSLVFFVLMLGNMHYLRFTTNYMSVFILLLWWERRWEVRRWDGELNGDYFEDVASVMELWRKCECFGWLRLSRFLFRSLYLRLTLFSCFIYCLISWVPSDRLGLISY